METIQKYFTKLTEKQLGQLAALRELYTDWNSKINVISRKDIDNLYLHHVLHSMAIAKAIRFRPGTKVLDFGTGGGFPGIPLAILFPETEASEVAKAIGLDNCHPTHLRAEQEKGLFDFVVSRAVMPLPDLIRIARKNISKKSQNALPNGFITLKGGNIDGEIQPFIRIAEVTPLTQMYEEEWFKEKYLIYVPI